jgi:hypothetical protein
MTRDIEDSAAITFAWSFYQALGFGRSIQEAFDLGCNQVALTGIADAHVPKLLLRDGVDAARLYFPAQGGIASAEQPTSIELGALTTAEQRLLARELLQKAAAIVTREATWSFRADIGREPLLVCVRARAAGDRGVLRALAHALEMMDALEDRIRFLEMQQLGPAGLAFDFGREARSRRAELEGEAASVSEALALLVHDLRSEP